MVESRLRTQIQVVHFEFSLDPTIYFSSELSVPGSSWQIHWCLSGCVGLAELEGILLSLRPVVTEQKRPSPVPSGVALVSPFQVFSVFPAHSPSVAD